MDIQIKFSTDCRLCPRLANFLDEVRQAQPDYFARPVPSFGDAQARLLIVGLAPGMHGANSNRVIAMMKVRLGMEPSNVKWLTRTPSMLAMVAVYSEIISLPL